MKLLKNNFTGEIANPKTEVEISFNNDVLSFNFVAHDSSLESYSDKKNDDLWRKNVVEVFLDLNDPDFYYEFEVAPNGAIFVAKKYKDKLVFINDDFFKSNVEIVGNSYKVLMKIDLKMIGKVENFKFNAFRIEDENLEALSPTFCDTFHKREKFISLDLWK